MAQMNVYRFAEGSVAAQEVDTSVFGVRSPRRVQREAALMYMANARAGTHSTLDRSDVRASKKKPWKQKHTGRARAGRKSSPLWRGGGVAHGPHPRDYSYSVPRKALRAATRAAMAGKIADGQVFLVESLELKEPCTRKMASMLEALGVQGAFLFVLPEHDEMAWKSLRNLSGARVMIADDVNALEVLRHRAILFTEGSLGRLAERVGMSAAAQGMEGKVR